MEQAGGVCEDVAGKENAAAKMKHATGDEEDDGDFLKAAGFFEGGEQVGN